MIINDENEKYYLQSLKVDFLTKRWEREWYALALMRAAEWGRKIDKQNEEYKRKSFLPDRYNV